LYHIRKPVRGLSLLMVLLFVFAQVSPATANWQLNWTNVDWTTNPVRTTADNLTAEIASPDDSVTSVSLSVYNGAFNPAPINLQGPIVWNNHRANLSFPLSSVNWTGAPLAAPGNNYNFALNVGAGQYSATVNRYLNNAGVSQSVYANTGNFMQSSITSAPPVQQGFALMWSDPQEQDKRPVMNELNLGFNQEVNASLANSKITVQREGVTVTGTWSLRPNPVNPTVTDPCALRFIPETAFTSGIYKVTIPEDFVSSSGAKLAASRTISFEFVNYTDYIGNQTDQYLMMPPQVSALTPMKNTVSDYLFQVPLKKCLPAGGSLSLIFPSSYSGLLDNAKVTSATPPVPPSQTPIPGVPPTPQPNTSPESFAPMNADINGPGLGNITILKLTVDKNNNKITLEFSDAIGSQQESNSYLSFMLSGITNPAAPPTETLKATTQTSAGQLLESLDLSNVNIDAGGNNSITINLKDKTSNNIINDSTAVITLGCPGVGLIKQTVVNGTTTFKDLAADRDYIAGLMTPPAGYLPSPVPTPVFLKGDTTLDLVLESMQNTSLTQVKIQVQGLPVNEQAVVYACSPMNFRETDTADDKDLDNDRTYSLYLNSNMEYIIGVRPVQNIAAGAAMPAPMTAMTWIPPMPRNFFVPNTKDIQTVPPIIIESLKCFIKVRVVDQSGSAIPNASVNAYNPSAMNTVGVGSGGMTDTDGYCLLKLKDGNYTVNAFKPGMPPVPEKTVVASASEPANSDAIVFSMEKPGRKIIGKVLNGNTGVASVPVFACQQNGCQFVDAITDNNGQFVLFVNPDTSWRLNGFVPGYGPLPEKTVDVGSTDVTNLSLTVPGGDTLVTVSGKVTKGGEAVSNVSVWAENTNGPGNGALTGADGSYQIKLKKGGSYILHCWLPGFGEQPSINLSSLNADLSDKNFNVVSRTITVNFGRSVNGFVGASNQHDSNSGIEINDKSSVEIKVPAGIYNVEAYVKGAGRLPTMTADTTNNDAMVDFTSNLSQGMVTINVQVNDGAGAAIPAAWATLEDASSKFILDGKLTSADGKASFVGPAGKMVKIRTQKVGYTPYASENITIAADKANQTAVMAALSNTVKISGSLTVSSGTLPSQAFIWATSDDGKWIGTVIQAANNSLSYELSLPKGNTWIIEAKADGFQTAAASRVTITPTAVMDNQDIALSPISNFNLDKANANVTPSTGGVISNPQAGIKLSIPPGALGSSNSNAMVTTQNTSMVPSTSSSVPVGGGKEITIKDGNGTAFTTLNGNMEITFDYSEYVSQLTADEIDRLQLAYWDNNIQDWVNIQSTNDKVNHVLRGFVNHLTKFAIVKPAASATSQNPVVNVPSGGGGGGSTQPPADKAVTSTTGNASVAPAAGGSVGLGTDAVVEIPANALKETTAVEVKVLKATSSPAAPSGSKLASEVYEFSVAGKNAYTFAKPVTLKLSFNSASISGDETVAVHYYDEANAKWVNVGGTVNGSIITVSVDHFTKFAVLSIKKPVETAKPIVTTVKLTDIAGHWGADSITKLVTSGAIAGYPDDSFKPDNNITRAEFASVLVKAFKLQLQTGKAFADTAQHWAKDSISTAAAAGIINGYSSSQFGPDDLVTREQMAVMVSKAAKLAAAKNTITFTDRAAISTWAKDAVASASEAGVISGYADKTFKPQGKATRAEAASIIVRAIK